MWVFRAQNINMKHLIFFLQRCILFASTCIYKDKDESCIFKNTIKNLTVDLYDLVREINII